MSKDEALNRTDRSWRTFVDHYAPLEPEDWPVTMMFGGSAWHEDLFPRTGIGRMWSENDPVTYPGERWGFDNGAWAAWNNDEPFDPSEFLCRIDDAWDVSPSPTVAVVPDIVAGGMDSLDRSLKWRGELERMGVWEGWPWYLPVQGDMDRDEIADVLPEFDGMFFGGGAAMKSRARFWLPIARDAGVPFHYGQCGTLAKLEHAAELGVDSLDSAGPVKQRSALDNYLARCGQLFFEEDAPLADE